MPQNITFERDGLTLAGHLHTPVGYDENSHYPAVIVQGSFTSVKEQMPDAYAAKFAAEGFIALAFDYSHYGQSGGQPRQFESPEEKLADLQAALTYLKTLPAVQAVGMVGICTSGSNAVYLAAADKRLNGLATIAGFIASPALYEAQYGADGIARRLDEAATARKKAAETGEATLIPVYSETDENAANYNPTQGAYDYYLNPKRANLPDYTNALDVTSWDTWTSTDPLAHASAVTTPTIVVHSDGSANPDGAKKLYESVQGIKELAWGDGNHYDYYDSPAQMNYAVEQASRFLRTHLV